MIDTLISISALALAAYAAFRNMRPGPAGPQGEKGDQGVPGQTVTSPTETPKRVAQIPAPTQSVETRPKFLTRQDRHDMISARADSSEFKTTVAEVAESRRRGSGIIPFDPEAQTSQPDWRTRNAR
jgi:hypothetical protein